VQTSSMDKRLDRAHRAIPLVLGLVTLISVGVLLAWDLNPTFFPAKAHNFLGALPLAMIAIAYLFYQSVRRPAAKEFVKAIMLAAAFLLWAANQFWPDLPQATLFNDLAIALFVLDVFLVIIGWPTTSPDESFAETYVREP
jgi:peptidoglycan/LPS O-acetylase OafA/YrhL